MKCIFCGSDYEFPKGMTEIDTNGTVRHFCSSKCRKNLKLGRDKRKIKWTQASRDIKEKRLAQVSEIKKK